MKKVLFLFILLWDSILFGQSEKILVAKINSIQIQAEKFVGFDALGSYYFIKNNTFYKYKKTTILEYKNPLLGNLSKVDIQNPLKIVLFYENFNTAIVLDNQLNEVQKINLNENTNPINTTAIGISSQNQLWIYNSFNQQIGLYDYLKNSYKTISLPISENIKDYQSDFNNFYWIDTKNNSFYCDIYGKIIALGKVPDYDNIQFVYSSSILYKKDKTLYYHTLNGDKATLIDLDKKSFENFYYKDQILSIFTGTEIINYKIKIP